MNNKKEQIDLVYLFLHQKLREKAYGNFINKKDAVMFLSHSFRIPKKLGYAVIKELEIFELIKKVPSQGDGLNLEILESNFDVSNTSDVYHRVGLN